MAQFENCEIKIQTVKSPGSFRGDGIHRWIVVKMTSAGEKQIYKSSDFKLLRDTYPESSNEWGFIKDHWYPQVKEEYTRMIAHLASEGWEGVVFTKYGYIKLMKRRIEEPGLSIQPGIHADLLQQLDNLKEAGLLTEEEYSKKKSELNKPITPVVEIIKSEPAVVNEPASPLAISSLKEEIVGLEGKIFEVDQQRSNVPVSSSCIGWVFLLAAFIFTIIYLAHYGSLGRFPVGMFDMRLAPYLVPTVLLYLAAWVILTDISGENKKIKEKYLRNIDEQLHQLQAELQSKMSELKELERS